MKMWSIHQENTTILAVHVQSNKNSNYMNQAMIKLRGETDDRSQVYLSVMLYVYCKSTLLLQRSVPYLCLYNRRGRRRALQWTMHWMLRFYTGVMQVTFIHTSFTKTSGKVTLNDYREVQCHHLYWNTWTS